MPKPRSLRQDGGWTAGTAVTLKGSTVIGYVAVLAAGYVLGTKAGRERYEQILGTYRALTSHPATKSVIDAGRRKIAERVSPDPSMVELTPIVEMDIETEADNVRD